MLLRQQLPRRWDAWQLRRPIPHLRPPHCRSRRRRPHQTVRLQRRTRLSLLIGTGAVVRFGFAIPSYGSGADGGAVAELLAAGEELGFESAWFPDHIAVPD